MFVVSPTIVANIELKTSQCLNLQKNNKIQHLNCRQNKTMCKLWIYGAREFIDLAS